MPNYSPSKKLSYVRRTGADLTLNLANAPWLGKVLKLTTHTVPGSSGNNARSAYTGAYAGLTPGGTLQVARQGQTYELNAGLFDGSLTLPDFVEVAAITSGTGAADPVTVDIDGTTAVAGETIFDASDPELGFPSAANLTAAFSQGSGTVQISRDKGVNWINLGATAYALPANTFFIVRVQHAAGAAFYATITATF